MTMRKFDASYAAKATQVKLVGYLAAVDAALTRLQPTSSIVLFGGIALSRPYPGGTMVSIVNGGVVGMTRTLAVELAPIRVNGVSPGAVVDSPRCQRRIAASSQFAGMMDALAARAPARRLTEMADIVQAVLFLMDNRGVNGVDLEVDGGLRLV